MGDNQYIISIGTDADTSNVDALADKLHELEDSANKVSDALGSTDSSGLDDASNSAENAAENLERADDAANDFSNDVGNVDGGALEDTANSADDAASSIDNASDSASGLDAVASGLASAGIVATMLSWADSSGNVSSQWSRMSLAMKNTGLTAAQVQNTYSPIVTKIADDTGRAGGQIREFFIQMANSGVTNSEVLQSSFEGIAGSAYITGRDVNALGEYFSRLTKTGKLVPKQLASQFAMSLPEIGNAMRKLGYDVSNNADEIQDKFSKMDETTRANVLGTALALKGGERANSDYKKSWDGLKQQMDKSQAGLFKFAGDLILPTLIPALILATDTVNGVTSAFKSAPAPVQQVLGVLGTLGAGFIALVLGISTVRSALGLLRVGETISDIKNLGTTFITSGKSALTAGANYVKNGVMMAASAAKTLILTLATWAQVAAQSMLNFVMSLNPFTIIVIAILALIVVLFYLWSTNEGFRNAVIGIWNDISGAFIYAGQQIYGALLWVWNGIVWFLGLIPQLPLLIGLYLAAAALRFVSFAINAAAGARNAGHQIYSGLQNAISGLAGMVLTELLRVVDQIRNVGGAAYNAAVNLGQQIYNGIRGALHINSPGIIYYMVAGELDRVVNVMYKNQDPFLSGGKGLGAAIISGFSNFSLNGINTTYPSISASAGYGSASLGYDATEINNVLSANSNENSKAQIIQYIDLNGIMSEEEAATTIVNAIVEQAEKENLITGKS